MAGLGRHYIWCKKDIVRTKEGYIDSSVGPNKDINICLHQDCSCSDLTDKIVEVSAIQASARREGGSVRRSRGGEQTEEVKPVRRRQTVAEEVKSIRRQRLEQVEIQQPARRRRAE